MLAFEKQSDSSGESMEDGRGMWWGGH
jgi:hypothetical protein